MGKFIIILGMFQPRRKWKMEQLNQYQTETNAQISIIQNLFGCGTDQGNQVKTWKNKHTQNIYDYVFSSKAYLQLLQRKLWGKSRNLHIF